MSDNNALQVTNETSNVENKPADAVYDNVNVITGSDQFNLEPEVVEAEPEKRMLIAHRGARRMTLAELAELPYPEPTRTHTPVQHAELVKSFIRAFQADKIEITGTEFAAGKKGQMIFGVLHTSVVSAEKDFRAAFGFRASNDKTMSIQANAGINVFVCDNMTFKADTILMQQPHVGGLDINATAAFAVRAFKKHFLALENDVKAWKEKQIARDQAYDILYDVFYTQDLLPVKLYPVVKEEYFKPAHDYHHPNTLWALNNAFTWGCKELEPTPQNKCLIELGTYFEKLVKTNA